MQQNTLHLLSDQELIVNYANTNCQQSFRYLVTRHKDRIYTLVYTMVRSRYMAEEILQETFIKAACHLKQNKYVEQGKFGAWLSRSAHNLTIDYIRREKSSRAIKTISEEQFDWERMNHATQTIEQRIIKDEKEKLVHDLISRLPKEQLDVLVLRLYGEYSFKEISEMMGVSINTSLGRMRYAIQHLKRIVEQEKIEV